MDGSAFELVVEGETAEASGSPVPLCATAAIAPMPTPTFKERLVHPFAVGLAAAAHIALVVAMLPVEAEVMGDGGTALESVAVAIVERVPMVAPPTAGARDAVVESLPDEAPQDGPPAAEAEKVEAAPPKPEVAREPLPEEPPPEQVAFLPAKPPEPEQKTEPPRAEPQQQQQAAAAPAEMAVAVVAVEASAGVVKAYESQLSRVIASRPPRPRGLKGRLVVELVIGKDGKPESTAVIEPSGRQALDAMVMSALLRLQFPVPPPEMTLRQRTFHQAFVYN